MPEDAPLELTNKILRGMRSVSGARRRRGAVLARAADVGRHGVLPNGGHGPESRGAQLDRGRGARVAVHRARHAGLDGRVRVEGSAGEDPVLHAPGGVVARHAGAAARQVVQVRQGPAQARHERPRALRGRKAQIDPQVHGLRLPRLLRPLGWFVVLRLQRLRPEIASTIAATHQIYAIDATASDRRRPHGQQKLDVVAECLDNQIAGPKYGFSPSSSTAAIYQCEVLVFELNQVRQEYRSALNASLPRGVFTTIIALMVAILYTFACRAAAMGSFAATRQFLSETVVRVLFSLTATSFFAILQVLSDLADTLVAARESSPARHRRGPNA